ncbi:hypothetical protein ABU162_04545 [Paenibacillus thiaminolyticus]|uniref:hypothetical protein n=1 Tax=Paenibacillus thiaminolyticus TaxID=49283 RepID=UPI0035A657F1
MNLIVWWLNICGLVVSAVGTFLIYKGTPLDSTGHTTFIESHATKEQYWGDYERMRKRGRLSQKGLVLLLAGFLLQGVAQVFNYPS